MFNQDDYKRPNGQIYHTYPSLKEKSDQAALWSGQLEGSIHTVATDELCCTLSTKTQGCRIDDVTGGNSGCEPRVAVMYTEMVRNRGYSLDKFVAMVSTNAARIMGLYPRKGALAAGADADITIYTPHENKEMMFELPRYVIKSGQVLVEEGDIRVEHFGKTLHVAPDYDAEYEEAVASALSNLERYEELCGFLEARDLHVVLKGTSGILEERFYAWVLVTLANSETGMDAGGHQTVTLLGSPADSVEERRVLFAVMERALEIVADAPAHFVSDRDPR